MPAPEGAPVPIEGPAASAALRRWAAPAATLVAGAACAAVGGLRVGSAGALAGALAAVAVTVFFTSGLLPLAMARAAGTRAAALLVVLTNYALRLVLLLVVLRLAARAGSVDEAALGISIVVCALTWTGVQAVLLARA